MSARATTAVFIATSLDGFIARRDGRIDWLDQVNAALPPGEDCGYHAFMASVDALVLGRRTYEQVLTFGAWPYGDKPVVVLSRQALDFPAHVPPSVTVSAGTPAELVARLTAQGARRLYVDGGVTIQRFLAAGLLDELIVTVVPVLLGEGRPLFGPVPHDLALALVETRTFPGGLVQSHYRVTRRP
jgi:dihydrofolate reductase